MPAAVKTLKNQTSRKRHNFRRNITPCCKIVHLYNEQTYCQSITTDKLLTAFSGQIVPFNKMQ